jgi:hypothetical protein
MRTLAALSLALLALAACEGSHPASTGTNPFLEDLTAPGKEDTLYLNPDGIEVEVDLEADVQAPAYKIDDAPAVLGQFALTYLRKNGEFYLESLAEDAASSSRVEWRIDGTWVSAGDAESVDAAKKTHWRIRGVNAVLLHEARNGVKEGTVFTAPVPVAPFSAFSEAGESCAEKDDHMGLSASIYWYLWDPDKSTCHLGKQDLTVTVAKMLPAAKVPYPEWDRLAQDKLITAVVLFGQIGDGAISDSDVGMLGFREMQSWLKEAGFAEVEATVGKRFEKTVNAIKLQYDLYSPHEFSGLSDMSHFSNFNKAIKEHEVVVYDGHSMLGASDFWERPDYPDSYQIFLYGGCLGYEYYVRPILKGKGGWGNVDIMSSVVEVSVGANEFAGPFLAQVQWAAQNDWKVSWKDVLRKVRDRVGDSTFGLSGVRDNCFTPAGSACTPEPTDPGAIKRYDSDAPSAIPDDSVSGVVSVIDVPDELEIHHLTLALKVTHSWVGDLRITLEHEGVEAVVWDNAGMGSQDIDQSFGLDVFKGLPAKGRWTLLAIDNAAQDTGTLDSWSLSID